MPRDNHPDATPNPVEAEVRANILAQPLVEAHPGAGTGANLNIPEPLLSRIADRIIRSTFEERHRNVYEDRPGRMHNPAPAPWLLDREQRPPLRAYRANVAPGDEKWPSTFPTDADPPELVRAAEHIGAHLAADGLPRTLADACSIFAPLLRTAPGRSPDLLRRAGFPVDLLDFFTLDARPLLERVLSKLTHGTSRESIRAEVARATFSFRQSRDTFHAIDDAGSQPASLFRLQVTRPDHWDGEGGGPGSGDNLDLLLNLRRALPHVRFVLSVAANHADALSASLAGAGVDSTLITVIPAELPVSQWAQDNLKPGLIDTPRERVALLPRYASRAEDGAKLDAGDSAALSHLAAAGIGVIQSPLHFQGGNVMLVRRPGGERLLLVGEAEIARNITLGLTAEQAGEALRIEMGADSILVLPAVGFHIDTEISARVVGNELTGFTPDEPAAARIILQSTLRALETNGVISRAETKVLHTFLDHQNDEQFVPRLGSIIARFADGAGNLVASFAAIFRAGYSDSGTANAQRVLLALDILAAQRPRPWEASLHPHAQAYFRSLRRAATDRRQLGEMLTNTGFRIVPVPSLSGGNRSASVINAVHLPDRVLMPVRGGFLKPLDDAAIKVMRSHLPSGVEIVPIAAAESERRGGAVHCSVGVFPDPNE